MMLLTAEDDIFVRSIEAVVAAITSLRSGNTLSITALELIVRTGVFADVWAERRLITRIATVVITVAVEKLTKSSKIFSFVFI